MIDGLHLPLKGGWENLFKFSFMYDGDHRFAFPSYHFPCHLLPVDKPSKSKHLCLPRIGSFLPNGSIRQVPLICVEYLYIKVTLIVSFLVAWTWHGWGRVVPRCLLPYTYMVSFSVWKPWILLGQPFLSCRAQNYKSWKLSSFKVRSKLCFCWSSISEKR